MLILLPPSETKRDGGVEGSRLAPRELGFPSLAAPRRTMLTALEHVSRDRDAAMAAKVAFHQMPPAEVAKMHTATQPVIDAWIKEMDGKGANGKALVDDARAMIAKYAK